MRTVNPKCTNDNSFKYSILISKHYYELNDYPERTNQLNKYMHKYKFSLNNTYNDFENNNPHISLSVYDKYGTLLHQSSNNSNNKAHVVKINDHRYNAINPNKDKYIILNNTLKLFTHKEIANHILKKIIQ